MTKWAFAVEDRDFAQLVPVENLPFEWTGPTASFDIDPTTVQDCWWEEKVFMDDHHQFTYHKTFDKEKGGDWIFDDCFLFFTSDEQMRTHWEENQDTPRDLKALYQTWYYYKSEDYPK